jgi:MerR family mercuric resistance operon transcriptional regulator
MQERGMRIGELAAAGGVGVETIRYYERRGLLAQPERPMGRHRLYPAATAERLRFIRRAQALGFTLEDIGALLKLNDGTGHVQARRVASKRLEEIEAKIADLQSMRDVLRQLVKDCEHAGGRVPCPIIGAMAHGEPKPRPG